MRQKQKKKTQITLKSFFWGGGSNMAYNRHVNHACMKVHTFNLTMWEVEAVRHLCDPGQPGVQSDC